MHSCSAVQALTLNLSVEVGNPKNFTFERLICNPRTSLGHEYTEHECKASEFLSWASPVYLQAEVHLQAPVK